MVILLFSLISYGQKDAVIDYMVVLKEKAFEKDKTLNDVLKIDKNASITFQLLINQNKSIFAKIDNLEKEDNEFSLLKIKAKTIGEIYLDLKEEKIYQEKISYNKKFIISDTLQKINWELINETKIINSRICYKAIVRDTIIKIIEDDKGNLDKIKKEVKTVAWYCPEININQGPLGYYGLPGLILVLEKDIFIYYAKNIRFELNDEELKKIKIPKKGKIVSKETYKIEYNKLKQKRQQYLKNK